MGHVSVHTPGNIQTFKPWTTGRELVTVCGENDRSHMYPSCCVFVSEILYRNLFYLFFWYLYSRIIAFPAHTCATIDLITEKETGGFLVLSRNCTNPYVICCMCVCVCVCQSMNLRLNKDKQTDTTDRREDAVTERDLQVHVFAQRVIYKERAPSVCCQTCACRWQRVRKVRRFSVKNTTTTPNQKKEILLLASSLWNKQNRSSCWSKGRKKGYLKSSEVQLIFGTRLNYSGTRLERWRLRGATPTISFDFLEEVAS